MSRMLDALKKLADPLPQGVSQDGRPAEIRPRRVADAGIPAVASFLSEPLRIEIPNLTPSAAPTESKQPESLADRWLATPPEISPESPPAEVYRGTVPIKDLMQQLDELDALTREKELAEALSEPAQQPPNVHPAESQLPEPTTQVSLEPAVLQPGAAEQRDIVIQASPSAQTTEAPDTPPLPQTTPPAIAAPVASESPPPFRLPPPKSLPTNFEQELLSQIASPSCYEQLAEISTQVRGLLVSARERTIGLAALESGAGHAPLAYALAKLLADQGERMLLVDGGVGLSGLSRALDYGAQPGWVDAAGTRDPLPWIVPTASTGLWFLPSGRGEPLGRTDCLAGWRRALDQFLPHFSLVLIDLGGIVESLLPVVGRLCDAVFLSAPLGVSSLAVQMRLAQLRRSGVRLRGCVGLELDPE